MNVKQIVIDWLKANGYDGLYHEDDCGCQADDLFPCRECAGQCEPGYIDNEDEDPDGHGWSIRSEKPEPTP